MKTLHLLSIIGCLSMLSSCNSQQSSEPKEVIDSSQKEVTIGDSTYLKSDIEKIISFYEQAKNPDGLEKYRNVTIPDTAGGLIDYALAKERIEYFKDSHSSDLDQPHAFSYGLKTMDKLRDKIEEINQSSINDGGKRVYAGIRIYVTRDLDTGEWNTALVGVTEAGKDVFSRNENGEFPFRGDPVYNSSYPCPINCQ